MKILVENTMSERLGEFTLSNQPVLIGRDDACVVRLPSGYVSRKHALIEPGEGGHVLKSLGSNPTLVNGKPLDAGATHRLAPNDKIGIGGFFLTVLDTARKQAEDQTELELQRRYSALKARLHEELIEHLDLRALTGRNLEERERWERFEEAFRLLLETPLNLEADLEEFVVREALEVGLIDRLVLPRQELATDRNERDRRDDSSDERFQVWERFLIACSRELGIGHDAAFDREAVRAVLEKSAGVFRRRGKEVPGNVRRWVIRRQIRRDLEDLVFGLGPLEDLIRTPNINEVMVVANDHIYVEKDGEVEETGRAFPREDDVEVAISRILAPAGRTVNRAQPIVDARLADGSRVHVVVPPIALRGPAITIRKFRADPFSVEDLIAFGSLNHRAVTLLRACVRSAKNMVVSGGTGSGKTTLLNTLSKMIPAGERIVVIEDSAELQLQQPHVVQLEARKANMEGVGAISIRDLVRASLRMRPDRIVVGECRGAEALDMLQAMNTGHDGSLTTAHANTPTDMISRLEVMVLEAGQDLPVQAIQRQIAGAVDIIVQIERMRDKVRRVTHVTEVVEYDPEEQRLVLEDILRLGTGSDGRPELKFTGYLPTFIEAVLHSGDLELEELF